MPIKQKGRKGVSLFMKINNNNSIKFGASYNESAVKKEIRPELKEVKASSLEALDASGRAQINLSRNKNKKQKKCKIKNFTKVKPESRTKPDIKLVAQENKNSAKSATVVEIIKENKNSMSSAENIREWEWESDSAMDYWRYSIYERLAHTNLQITKKAK